MTTIKDNPPISLEKCNLKPKYKVIAVHRFDNEKVRYDPGNKKNYRIYTVKNVSTVVELYQVSFPFSLCGLPILNGKSIYDPEYMFWEDYKIAGV